MTPPESAWWHQDIWGQLKHPLGAAQYQVLLITPYVGMAPVQGLLSTLRHGVGVTLITSLDPVDLATGASDVEALLKISGYTSGSVRVLPRLHVKIYIRDWEACWIGSANFTGRGLGLVKAPNLETLGFFASLPRDVRHIAREILATSLPVTHQYLSELRELLPEWRQLRISEMLSEPPVLPAIPEPKHGPIGETFLLQELPLLDDPAMLWSHDPMELERAHDQFLLGIEPDEESVTMREKAARGVTALPVVKALDVFLQQPRRFGELTNWFHDRIIDQPVPYRSEIKKLAQRVTTWLSSLHPEEYEARRPGHSTFFGRRDADWTDIEARAGRRSRRHR